MTVVEKPEGFDEFCDLATRLYDQPRCNVGGPLHVELEDHEAYLLVGDEGESTAAEIAAALAMVESGNIPTERLKFNSVTGWPDGTAENHLAIDYGNEPETLRIAAAILAITVKWSEDQADAAYAVWAEAAQGGACTCQTYPTFREEQSS